MSRISQISILGFLFVALAGCGTLDKIRQNDKTDYRKSSRAPRLEVPPDLASSTIDDALVVPEIAPAGSATYSDYDQERNQAGVIKSPEILAESSKVKVQRDSDRQWLIIEGDTKEVWASVRQFWLANGFVVEKEDSSIGIMETGWAENRADIPQGPVRRLIGKAFDRIYSAATRDKYRVRMERGGQDGTLEIFLTHRGMEEVVQGSPDENQDTIWKPRASDPELETEMLKRIMVHLGAEEKRAVSQLAKRMETAPKARLVGQAGKRELLLTDEFPRAWRNVGIALDRSGFLVEDRDRSKGTYYVKYNDPDTGNSKKGVLSKLAFWKSKPKKNDVAQYQVKLTELEKATRVSVLNNDGQAGSSKTAQRILTLLQEQLK